MHPSTGKDYWDGKMMICLRHFNSKPVLQYVIYEYVYHIFHSITSRAQPSQISPFQKLNPCTRHPLTISTTTTITITYNVWIIRPISIHYILSSFFQSKGSFYFCISLPTISSVAKILFCRKRRRKVSATIQMQNI